jgi:hypothetical protein
MSLVEDAANKEATETRVPYAAGMLLHINGKFTMGKLKSSLCRKVSFLTATHCLFRGVGQYMKQTYLYLWLIASNSK